MGIVRRSATSSEGTIGRIGGGILGGRPAADIGRGAVQAVQGTDADGVGWEHYRGRGRLNEAIVSVRHTRRRVMNRTFTTPEFIGGPVTDG